MSLLKPRVSPDKRRSSCDAVICASGCEKELQEAFGNQLNFSQQEPPQQTEAVQNEASKQAVSGLASERQRPSTTASQALQPLPRHKRSVPKFLNELSVRTRNLKGNAESGPKFVHASSEGCLVSLLRARLQGSRSN